MTIGDNIKKIRTDKNITQKQLADRINVSAAAISQFEKSDSLRIDTLQKIAEALEVELSNLIAPYYSEILQRTQDKAKEAINLISRSELSEECIINNSDRMNEVFDVLNDTGQEKAIEQVELLAKIPEYKKK